MVDNASCDETKRLLKEYAAKYPIRVITNDTNLGTALAVNMGWRIAEPTDHLVKMDNDVVIHEDGWVDTLISCIEKDPKIGIIGLKRKDLWETPFRNDFYRSELVMLPHEAGETWKIVEKVNHVMGTCQMYNRRLIDEIGGMYQMGGLYGFDDSLAAVRCKVAGFYSCFYPHIEIDHIDAGDTPYQKWKEGYVGPLFAEYDKVKTEFETGKRDIYFPI